MKKNALSYKATSRSYFPDARPAEACLHTRACLWLFLDRASLGRANGSVCKCITHSERVISDEAIIRNPNIYMAYFCFVSLNITFWFHASYLLKLSKCIILCKPRYTFKIKACFYKKKKKKTNKLPCEGKSERLSSSLEICTSYLYTQRVRNFCAAS